MKVYYTNAIVSVYVFKSSFQSQLEVFGIIKNTIVTTNSILHKEKSYGWKMIW